MRRTSAVWNLSKEELAKIVKNSDSLSSILKYFDLAFTGGNHKTLKKRLKEDNIDYSHIKMGKNSNKGRRFPSKAIPLEQIMIKNSTYSRGHLKKRLLKGGILENKCIICGQLPFYNNMKLVMVLDHINGVPNDHRKKNLRLLCPNCNSQQDTFAEKRNKKYYYCEQCGKEKGKNSKMCSVCDKIIGNIKRRKVKDRPSKEQLLQGIKETNYCAVGRKYGVSDNTIRKWLK